MSKNRTGDLEIKNKLTVTRGGEEDNGGKGKPRNMNTGLMGMDHGGGD